MDDNQLQGLWELGTHILQLHGLKQASEVSSYKSMDPDSMLRCVDEEIVRLADLIQMAVECLRDKKYAKMKEALDCMRACPAFVLRDRMLLPQGKRLDCVILAAASLRALGDEYSSRMQIMQ